jgi:DNA-binding transcriptional regulator YiaG
MTPTQFKDARERLGLSQAELSLVFGVATDRTVRRWEAGERDIPGPVIVLMKLIMRSAEARQILGLRLHGDQR